MSFNESFQAVQQMFNVALVQQSVPFVLNQNKIDKCIALLSDECSKAAYQNELSYLMMRGFNENLATILSPCTKADWQEITDRWPAFEQSKECPEMFCERGGQGFDQKFYDYVKLMLTTTFIAQQYRYNNEVKVEFGEIFIDCGACFGDTSMWAYQQGASAVYSFEPTPYSFNLLQKNITANKYDPSNCFNLAVGSTNTKIPFSVRNPYDVGASHADTNGDVMVDCVVLDDWFAQHKVKPTFLKFDIEGSEYDALQGCRKTITELKPKIAVCLYHNIEDMWKLPLLIHEMVPEYRFYCRKNNVQYEFILYATV